MPTTEIIELDTPKTVTIQRSRWLRGTNPSGSSCLFDEDKDSPNYRHMCCLGFTCLAAGCDILDIKGIGSPGALAQARNIRIDDFLDDDDENNGTIKEIILVNDAIEIPDPAREKLLTRLFKDLGISVTFID